MLHTLKTFIFLFLAVSLSLLVFLKNAWVTEDAYIIFRSIEQLFAGNGPIWNPHERVQVFTSPLWYVVLAFVRLFSSDIYLVSIITSLVLWLATVFVLYGIVKHAGVLLLAVLLLISSTSFFDYTSSGLENVLAYLIITIYVYYYLSLFSDKQAQTVAAQRTKTIFKLLVIYGLLICVRHDLSLLLLPAMLYVVIKNWGVYAWKQWLFYGLLALTPFILYSLFSLLYYGFLFPNTAYAKLNTGIPQSDLFIQGLNYLYVTFKYDVITAVIILSALILAFLPATKSCFKYLGLGLILNLFYVSYVGGDFMMGRFLSFAYLLAVIMIVIHAVNWSLPVQVVACVLVTIYATYYHHTPANSPIKYKNQVMESGVADERGFYFNQVSLYSYFKSDRNNFPQSDWVKQGRNFKTSDEKLIVRQTIGLFGYYAGVDKIIIDPFALADPLLARLSIKNIPWRIGHFVRHIPEGYEDSVKYNREVIHDPNINAYYKKLKLITQSKDLFSYERLRAIVLFNIGAYDYLLEDQ